MKSWVQTLILLVVFAALVGGITFVAQSINTRPDSPSGNADPSASPAGQGFHLTFPETTVARATGEEVNSAGHQDFWFDNVEPSAVILGLDQKSCRCAHLEVLVLTPEERKQIAPWPPAPGDPRVLGLLQQKGRWQPLEEKKQEYTLPPQAAGAIRMNWLAREAGATRLKVQLWTASADNRETRAYQVIEVTVNFLPALLVRPNIQNVPDLEPGMAQSVDFDCWSPTRSNFHLQAKEESDDSHLACTLKPLTAQECQDLAANPDNTDKTPVLSGYRLTLAVREQVGTQQMDIGPFRRKILLCGDPGLEATVEVTGLVRGNVLIGAPEDKDRINLGHFAAADGAGKTLPLETRKRGLTLELESKFPSYLEVQLTGGQVLPEGGQRWELRVTVPPNLPSGRLPRESAVILKTLESSPRRIRIPVVGAAYR